MVFIILLFVFFVGGGWLIGHAIGEFLFPNEKEKRNIFIDRSVHYHEHKHINIIDPGTKESIFELKESVKNKS